MRIRLFILAALAVVVAATTAGAQCDPNGFTTDPADFAGVSVEDFENTGLTEWAAAPDIAFPGFNLVSVQPDNTPSGQIALFPPMGASLPFDTYFIGTLGLAVRIEPLGAADRVGVDYGTQNTMSAAEVETSDGMIRQFNFAGTPVPGGTVGFFGYDTCDPAITVVRVVVNLMADGGIDNVRCPGCGPVVEPTGACCSDIGECSVTTQADCAGDYHGDDTTCDDPEECTTTQPEVTLCHIPPGNPGNAHTITVPQPAVQAHLDHGDTLGPCPDNSDEDSDSDSDSDSSDSDSSDSDSDSDSDDGRRRPGVHRDQQKSRDGSRGTATPHSFGRRR